MIRIIIVDDHPLFGQGLASLLKEMPDMGVVGRMESSMELLEQFSNIQADLILLDINMPGMNGLEALRFIRQRSQAIRIIMLSTYSDEQLEEKARDLGANGYLLKTTSQDELVNTIRMVYGGKSCFPCKLANTKSEFADKDDFLRQFKLSKREKEIIQLIRDTYTNQQIADKLHLSIYTVETHRKNIMQKLQVKSPLALMKFLMNNSGF